MDLKVEHIRKILEKGIRLREYIKMLQDLPNQDAIVVKGDSYMYGLFRVSQPQITQAIFDGERFDWYDPFYTDMTNKTLHEVVLV